MAHKFAAVVFSLGCLQASSAMALGLGELTLESFLNEPLKASVDLLNTGGLHSDEIRIRLATREDFEKMGLDRAYFLTSIKFVVTTDERGRARINVTSDDPVLEPYLDFIVEARWPSGRLLREYTVLVDPPVFSQASPVISASQRVAEVEGIPAPSKKKQGSAASSGTRVDIKKSDLAPGEMPQRGYNASTSASPMPGSRYMINRDDTLWEIAEQARPQGASVHQTMLDIQRLNPEAFIDGNINRVKAGYIVYLPSSDDISSADLAAALSEVRQQNEDWRDGRASQPASSSGPSLRISAAPEESGESTEAVSAGEREVGASAVALEDLDKAELDRSESEERLVAMEQQVETLERIVNLKDDQIAALQAALANAGGSADAVTDDMLDAEASERGAIATLEGAAESEIIDEQAMPGADGEPGEEGADSIDAAPVTVAPVEQPSQAKSAVSPEPAPAAPPASKPPAQRGGGFMSYILYALGAAVLAVLGFVFMRRKGDVAEETAAPVAAPAKDVFSEVELQDQTLEVMTPERLEVEPEPEEESLEPTRDNRGYGEHKHDEYASDVEAADALAEADIYIAYGRYPQAMDLLNNAVTSEPNNPVYRLKLLELHAEMGDRPAADLQFARLQEINDPASLARAEEIIAGFGAAAPVGNLDDLDLELSSTVADASGAPGLAPNPIELMSDGDEPLEADFSGLEIEEPGMDQSAQDDLDLSADFEDSALAQDDQGEDLVIAAESNGMSTKLDLARAYLDMGDDEGARQILEEVASEGNEELKAEALALLERIG